MRAPMFGAFALTLLVAAACLFVGVIVTAGISGSMSAREAGDLLMWMGAGQLGATVGLVGAYGWLSRKWSGASPPWWSQGILGVLILAAAVVLFFLAMVMMNR